MKAFWKVLGFAALAAGLTPYKVDKDEETGESSYQALLWRITANRSDGEKKWDIGVNLGEGTLTSKLMQAAEKKEEAHLFSDELSVEYKTPDAEDIVAEVTEKVAEAAESAVESVKETVEETAEKAAEAVEAAEEAVEEIVQAAEAEEPKAE